MRPLRLLVGVPVLLAGVPTLLASAFLASKLPEMMAALHGVQVVRAEAARIDPANQGKLVIVSGTLAPREKLKDKEFGFAADALRLQRRLERFEPDADGRLSWIARAPVEFSAAKVALGAYEVDIALYGERKRFEDASDDWTYLDGRPSEPKSGDRRVRHAVVPAGQYTVVATQSQGRLEKRASGKATLALLEPGAHELPHMLEDFAPAGRLVALLFGSVGLGLTVLGVLLVR